MNFLRFSRRYYRWWYLSQIYTLDELLKSNCDIPPIPRPTLCPTAWSLNAPKGWVGHRNGHSGQDKYRRNSCPKRPSSGHFSWLWPQRPGWWGGGWVPTISDWRVFSALSLRRQDLMGWASWRKAGGGNALFFFGVHATFCARNLWAHDKASMFIGYTVNNTIKNIDIKNSKTIVYVISSLPHQFFFI